MSHIICIDCCCQAEQGKDYYGMKGGCHELLSGHASTEREKKNVEQIKISENVDRFHCYCNSRDVSRTRDCSTCISLGFFFLSDTDYFSLLISRLKVSCKIFEMLSD